ncbi:hypothetical protein CMV24_06480 [Pseudomonas plecoglossicida]|uniref:Uncharacterized protein n=1 Tax=Pseudomonas plecoglossicida TaxID=70775 RepID=A0A2A3M8A4_PSEDL|nr:hypothetical protein CMV24_06480 [Pseudomonas plecoglossicida]
MPLSPLKAEGLCRFSGITLITHRLIASADTPNYKTRDMDFAAVLAAESDKPQSGQPPINVFRSQKSYRAQGGRSVQVVLSARQL